MVNTINPADCDRVTVYTGECRNFQDTEWITFNSGRRRSPNAHDGNTWLIDVAHGSFWMRDDQVRDLVRLVPARPVTRDDLPSNGDAYLALMEYGMVDRALDARDMDGVLDAVVEHLNANGGAPAGDGVEPWPEVQIGVLEHDCARLRRAHEIVEQERDHARESLRRLRDETDFDLFTVRDQLKQCRGEREQMTRERDEARADRDHYRDSLGATVTERDEWKARAEAAEARTAPAVTREDVKGVIDHWIDWGGNHEALMDDLWSLVSGADPAVLVVRESDVAAVEVERDSHDEWFADGEHIYPNSAEDARNLATGHLRMAVRRLAVARAIEAGQAVDPLLDKAQEFAALADWELTDREAELLHTVARHVLGQEAKR